MSKGDAPQMHSESQSNQEVIDPNPVLITGMAAGGDGVGRLSDGRVVFVEGGVPGDRVELSDLVVQKKLAKARVGRLIEPSSSRVEPRCSHFGSCGGCLWQHMSYEAQLTAKRAIVRDTLERIGGLSLPRKIEIIGSPDPYGYRARARLVELDGRLGYRERGSHAIQTLDECPILTSEAESALMDLTRSVASAAETSDPNTPTKNLRARRRPVEWIISTGTSGQATTRKVTRHSARGRNRNTKNKIGRTTNKKRDEGDESDDARETKDAGGGREWVTLEVLGERLRASSESFIQGNALLWEALTSEVLLQCTVGRDASSPLRFIELYAGIGFLTLPLARAFGSGVVIESDRSALSDLGANLASSGLRERVEILRGRVEDRGDLEKRFAAADVLLTDPPRTGLDAKVREAIAAAGPNRLVYVSCDPATLARDLRVFVGAGYTLESVCALDLFPQTPHVEIVARLERGDGSGFDKTVS